MWSEIVVCNILRQNGFIERQMMSKKNLKINKPQKIECQPISNLEEKVIFCLTLLNRNIQNRKKIAVKIQQRGGKRKQTVEKDIQMVDACLRRSDFSLCLPILISLHEQHPNRTDIITKIAIAYKKIKQYTKATLFFRKLIDIQPLNCQHYIQASRTLLLERNGIQALKIFLQGESQISNVNIFFNYEKANILYQGAHFQDAFVAYRKTFEQNPIFLPGHLGMARCWLRLDNIVGLLSIMQSLNFINPKNIICQALVQLICLRLKLHQPKFKIPRIHVSLEIKSAQYEDFLYFYLGQLYYHQYDYKAALFYLKKYKEKNKNRAPTHDYAIVINTIALILTELKQANEAIEHFEWIQREILSNDKRLDAPICLNLAVLGRYHEIKEKLTDISRFIKENKTAAAEMTEGYWIQVCFMSGLYKEVVDHYEIYRAENPYQYENCRILSIFFTLKCYCALGMLGKAKNCFLKIWEHKSFFLRSQIGFNLSFNNIIQWGIENSFEEIATEMILIGEELSRQWAQVINPDFLEEYRSLLDTNKAALKQAQESQ